jgi:hypothetical protein
MRVVTGLAAAILAAVPAMAGASPVNARLTTQGVQFVENMAKSLVPSHVALDPISMNLFDCGTYSASFTQSNTTIDITLESFSLQSMAGFVRADLTVSVSASGQADFDKIVACYGHETCQDSVSLSHAHFVIDLAANVDNVGKPHFALKNLDMQLTPDQVDIEISGCPEAGVVNGVVDVVKKYGLQLGEVIATGLAENKVGPLLEQAVGNYLTYSGSVAFVDFKAQLTGLDISTQGIAVSGDLALSPVFPIASCEANATDPGMPGAVAGPAPDLGSGTPTDVNLSVNLGVVQSALYLVWHQGLMCITQDTLETLKVDLSAISQLGGLIPGFPVDTVWSLEATVAEPPRVEGEPANEAKLAVHIDQLGADIIATLPDHTSRTLHLDLAVTLTASVVMDAASNALALKIDGAKIESMNVVDHLGLEASGVDIDKIKPLLETNVLPAALSGIGQIPITGPVFGAQGVYVILKDLKTTPAYLGVKADLFMAPANDKNAPKTMIVTKPNGIVNPANAKLVFGGSDMEDPADLLQYHVIVDGKSSPPTFMKELQVGTAGRSQVVHVEVHAVDLAGNEDKAGVAADVNVDGVAPTVMLVNPPRGVIDQLSPSVAWTATDDKSAVGKIAAHITVTDAASKAKVDDRDLGAGTSQTTLKGLVAAHTYTATVTVSDEAGNIATTQATFGLSNDASNGGGGCAVGHGADGALSALLVGLALLVPRRRRA